MAPLTGLVPTVQGTQGKRAAHNLVPSMSNWSERVRYLLPHSARVLMLSVPVAVLTVALKPNPRSSSPPTAGEEALADSKCLDVGDEMDDERGSEPLGEIDTLVELERKSRSLGLNTPWSSLPDTAPVRALAAALIDSYLGRHKLALLSLSNRRLIVLARREPTDSEKLLVRELATLLFPGAESESRVVSAGASFHSTVVDLASLRPRYIRADHEIDYKQISADLLNLLGEPLGLDVESSQLKVKPFEIVTKRVVEQSNGYVTRWQVRIVVLDPMAGIPGEEGSAGKYVQIEVVLIVERRHESVRNWTRVSAAVNIQSDDKEKVGSRGATHPIQALVWKTLTQ